MSNQTNEHIEKYEKVKFDCGTSVTLTHMSPTPGDESFLAGVVIDANNGGGGLSVVNGKVEILFYIRNIPSIIHMLQRIYKTGMGTH